MVLPRPTALFRRPISDNHRISAAPAWRCGILCPVRRTAKFLGKAKARRKPAVSPCCDLAGTPADVAAAAVADDVSV